MSMLRAVLGTVLIVALIAAGGCQTGASTAKPGDESATVAPPLGTAAPPLRIAEWVKGKPVDLAAGQGQHVYVIEFWATWCGPCRASIPHLTEMQKKFKNKGVVFVGVTNEQKDLGKVKSFVQDMGDKMDYTVAVDDGNATFDAYMKTYKQNGIPHAFLIDKQGKIVWHDHPMQIEETIDQLVAGKFDRAAAQRKMKERDEAQAAAQKVFTLRQKYFELVSTAGNAEQARQVAEDFLKQAGKSAPALNDFAWTLLTSDKVKERDLQLGLRVAQAAYDASQGQDAPILDTYARALFDNGKKAEAIKFQKKAVELCKDETMRQELQQTLDRYTETNE